MSRKYTLIVRDKICMLSPATDSVLEVYKCYYKSPTFWWDGSLAEINAIIDGHQESFRHFIDWTAEVVPV